MAKTIHIRCIYGIFGRKFTKYTVIYGVYIIHTVLANPIYMWFWPALLMTIITHVHTHMHVRKHALVYKHANNCKSYFLRSFNGDDKRLFIVNPPLQLRALEKK